MCTYIVDTPASIAEESVSAVQGVLAVRTRDRERGGSVQHCKPMRKAKRTTGAVYCPSALYDGWVSVEHSQFLSIDVALRGGSVQRRYRYAKSEHSRPTAYAPHVRAAAQSCQRNPQLHATYRRRRTHADKGVVDESVDSAVLDEPPCVFGSLYVRFSVQS